MQRLFPLVMLATLVGLGVVACSGGNGGAGVGGAGDAAPGADPGAVARSGPAYRSPFAVAYSPDGQLLAVSDYTAGGVTLLDVAGGKIAAQVALRGQPAGLAWAPQGQRVFVAECGAGTVAEVDAAAGKVVRRLPVGARPVGVALCPRRGLLLAANSATHDLSVVDLATGKEKARITGMFWPYFLAVTPDEKLAVVGNLLPGMPATDPETTCTVSLIDLDHLAVVGDLRLPPNANAVHEIAISPDGKFAYVAHLVGRTNLPTSQIERGWINTNALSIIDLAKKELLATVLLDQVGEGAADPWGVAVAKDGSALWVTLSGVHQVGRLDLAKLHPMLEGKPPPGGLDGPIRTLPDNSVWAQIQKDPSKREQLSYDLSALYAAGLFTRHAIPGKGPRGIGLAPDGKQLAVATYFSGAVDLLDPATCKASQVLSVGDSPAPGEARQGEMVFYDATWCFQHWLSCGTCHPDTRADGLNWDLLNDGIGNPKNTHSLVNSYQMPPVMSHGIRPNMEAAVEAGFKFIEFRQMEEKDLDLVRAYLRTLRPEPSPYLVSGKLSAKAQQGKKVFESEKTGCTHCHSGPLFTDLKLFDVGTRSAIDSSEMFKTPTLREVWRTPPYLHDGRAVTLEEVFGKFNPKDQHGKTAHLSKEEIEALAEYLRSL